MWIKARLDCLVIFKNSDASLHFILWLMKLGCSGKVYTGLLWDCVNMCLPIWTLGPRRKRFSDLGRKQKNLNLTGSIRTWEPLVSFHRFVKVFGDNLLSHSIQDTHSEAHFYSPFCGHTKKQKQTKQNQIICVEMILNKILLIRSYIGRYGCHTYPLNTCQTNSSSKILMQSQLYYVREGMQQHSTSDDQDTTAPSVNAGNINTYISVCENKCARGAFPPHWDIQALERSEKLRPKPHGWIGVSEIL